MTEVVFQGFLRERGGRSGDSHMADMWKSSSGQVALEIVQVSIFD